MDWAEEELGTINLGDKRLNVRAKKLLRKKRLVKQEIYLKEVALLPSARKKKSVSLPAKTIVIIVSEIDAPANENQ